MSLDWMRGYRTEWLLRSIDPRTWSGIGATWKLKSFKVVNSGEGEVPLLQSGSMTVVVDQQDVDKLDGWYQLFVTLVGGTGMESLALATMLFESSSTKYDFSVGEAQLKGQSVLKPCADRHMEDGEFIPKDVNGAEWCRKVLARSTPAPVVIDKGKFKVSRNYVFDSGTSYLKAVWTILSSAGWVMRVTGDGTIHLCAKRSIMEPSLTLDRPTMAVISPGVNYVKDVSEVPNLYFASFNGEIATARNNAKSSSVSIRNRGYTKDVVDTDPVLIDGESLDHYAKRKLEESSVVIKKYTYTREMLSEVCPFDVVRVNIPGIYMGNARVISQNVSCSDKGGLTIEETVGEEVRLWTRS